MNIVTDRFGESQMPALGAPPTLKPVAVRKLTLRVPPYSTGNCLSLGWLRHGAAIKKNQLKTIATYCASLNYGVLPSCQAACYFLALPIGHYGLGNSGMVLRIKSSNRGTVNAMSPCDGL